MPKTSLFGKLCLSIALIAPLSPLTRVYTVTPQHAALTTLYGPKWAYSVPFSVHNKLIIEKLIQCESQGLNIARPDSNDLISWGILQFNGTSTWAEMSRLFEFHGSPLRPSDAIHMADLMISAGYLYRWTCAWILDLHA